jgi:hypothetical protein
MSKIPTTQNFLIMNEKKFNKYISGDAFPILEKLLKEYAKLVRAETLKVAAEEAVIHTNFNNDTDEWEYYTDKQSILDLVNHKNLEIK